GIGARRALQPARRVQYWVQIHVAFHGGRFGNETRKTCAVVGAIYRRAQCGADCRAYHPDGWLDSERCHHGIAQPTQIEIAHIVYAIQPNSPASKVARSFYVGQVVDAVLSAPGVNSVSQVVSLAAHAGT